MCQTGEPFLMTSITHVWSFKHLDFFTGNLHIREKQNRLSRAVDTQVGSCCVAVPMDWPMWIPTWGIFVARCEFPKSRVMLGYTDVIGIPKSDMVRMWILNDTQMAVCQNLVPLVNIKIAGKWMFIPLKMVLIGIDPYPNNNTMWRMFSWTEGYWDTAVPINSWQCGTRKVGTSSTQIWGTMFSDKPR